MNVDPIPRILLLREVAATLRISQSTVRRLIREEARRRGILSFDNAQHQI